MELGAADFGNSLPAYLTGLMLFMMIAFCTMPMFSNASTRTRLKNEMIHNIGLLVYAIKSIIGKGYIINGPWIAVSRNRAYLILSS